MTKRRALEILRDFWGYKRPLTTEVAAEIAASNVKCVEPFLFLSDTAGLAVLSRYGASDRDVLDSMYDPVCDDKRVTDAAAQGIYETSVWLSHDYVRRSCEVLLARLPEVERENRIRREWMNGDWTDEPPGTNDHPGDEPSPIITTAFREDRE